MHSVAANPGGSAYFEPFHYSQDRDWVMQLRSPGKAATASSSQLGNASLFEFLDGDLRPTFILDTEHSHVAYQNPALDHHVRASHSWDSAAFHRWALSLASSSTLGTLSFADQTWVGTRFRQRYIVVNSSCANEAPPTPAETPLVTPVGPSPPRTRERSATDLSVAVSDVFPRDSRRYSVASSSWHTIAASDDSSTPGGRIGLLDWTKYDMAGLSRHLRLVKRFAWATTSLGGMGAWSDVLRQVVVTIMANPEPRLLLWGDDRRMVYNEACITIFGQKHPRALGARVDEVWPEVWPDLAAVFEAVETEGRATKISNMPLILHRSGYDEETFWSFSLMPIIGPNGRTVGIVDEFTETTSQVVGDRRRNAILEINQLVAQVNTVKELWFEFLEGLEQYRDDVAYAMLYSSATNHDPSAVCQKSLPCYALEGSIGLPTGHPSVPSTFDMDDCMNEQRSLASACRQAVETGGVVTVQSKDATLPPDLALAIPGRVGGETVNTVCVLPIPDLFSNQQFAFLVLALSPRLPFNSEHAAFVHWLRDILAKSASTIFLPEEHRRARQRFEEVETSLAQQLRATALEAERVEARYAKIFQLAPVGMYAITPDSRTLFFNEAYLNISGIARHDVENGAEPGDAIHEDDLESVQACWLQCLQDKQPFMLEYRLKKLYFHIDPASGEEVAGETWVVCKAMPELDENGNVVHIQGYLIDISERKHHESIRIAQIENERSEARFARLAETAPLGMYLLKPDGKSIYLNDAYFDILGFTREEFEEAEKKGLGWGDQIHEDDVLRVTEAWRNLSEYGVPLDLEYRIKKQWRSSDPATGTEMTGPTWLQGTAVAEMGSDNKPIAVQGFVTEISLKKFSERLLAERLEEALETKRAADRFIDTISHEVLHTRKMQETWLTFDQMRNPLSAILQCADGMLTSLETSGMPVTGEDVIMSEETMKSLLDSAQTIILCAQHQKRIADDILTLSKLDSNLLVISPDQVSAPGLLEKSFKMYEAELERAGVDACLAIEKSYAELDINNVMVDSSRLLQVVINLLSNAIKFTQYAETRKITIYLGASTTRPTDNHHNASMIERRETRTEHTMTDEWGDGEDVYLQIAVEDTGRGLNEEELGHLFHRFQQASPKTYKQYGGSGLGLFISRELTELQGGQIGVTSEAGKGSIFAFYVKARRCIPGSDDFAAPSVKSPFLKAMPAPSWSRKSSIVSIDAAQSLAASIQSVQKPPLKHKVSAFTPTTPQQPTASSSLHVLVVEDNVINQRVMAQQLRRLGCTVHLANHGLEALEFLETTIHWHDPSRTLQDFAEPPSPRTLSSATPLSVVLMDLEMPVLGGLDCVKQIRELQAKGQLVRHVPVIAVTANARKEQITAAIEHGMDSVVTKPFRIPDLVPKMEELVQQIRARELE
ncbi:hypothetical protein MBLNU459_g1939t1 [Dothideomycetes sp. NU459]